MVEINLLPAQYRKRTEPNVWRYATLALPVVTVLGIAVFSVIQNNRLGSIQAALDANTSEIKTLQSAKDEFDALNRQKADLQKVTAVSKTLQASKTYWSSDLARFVNALPSGGGVALTTLTMKSVDSNTLTTYAQQGLYNGKAVSKEFDLTGQAATSQALVNFLNSFETNPNFGVNFKTAQRTVATSPTGTPTTTAATNVPYTFSATIGLVGQPTAATATTGAATGTTSSTPATGGSNVR